MIFSTAAHGLAWLLAAYFAFGAYNNGFPTPQTVASYERWGYPPFFYYVTAALELSAAILIAVPQYRIAGAALGALLMLAAIGTLVVHGACSHTRPPLLILGACLVVAGMTPAALRALIAAE